MVMKAGDPVKRFWSKVDKSGECWLWTASLDSAGYGQININRRLVLSHRYSFSLANGPIPPGMLVCHTCDTPRCVRPDHLFLGTHADNAADMCRKGRVATGERSASILHRHRRPRGERHPKARLTEEMVREIRRRRESGEGIRAMARELGMGHTTISLIVRGLTWTHV